MRARATIGLVLAAGLASCDAPPPKPAYRPADACRLARERREVCEAELQRGEDGGRVGRRPPDEELDAECQESPLRTIADDHAGLACLELGHCFDVLLCLERLDREIERRARKVELARVTKRRTVGTGALQICREDGQHDPEFVALCAEVYAAQLREMAGMLAEVRDGGDHASRTETRKTCDEWQGWFSTAPAEVRRGLAEKCAEVEAAGLVEVAGRDVEQAIERRERTIPLMCGRALESLEPLRSDWARQARVRLAYMCHVDFGRAVLPRLVPKAKRCEPPLDRIYAAVKLHGFEDPGIDKWIERLDRVCPAAEK